MGAAFLFEVRVVAQIEVSRGITLANRCPEANPRVQKQKIGLDCNFFAIADCYELPNRELRCKNAGKSVVWRSVFALRGRKRVRNRKKVAKKPRFLFSRWADFLNGQISQRTDSAMGRFRDGQTTSAGQIAQTCGLPAESEKLHALAWTSRTAK